MNDIFLSVLKNKQKDLILHYVAYLEPSFNETNDFLKSTQKVFEAEVKSYIADQSGNIFENEKDIVRGYLRVAELTDEELKLIPHLTMARVIARGLITTRRAQLFPYNVTYILRNTEPGWAQLEWFLARSIEEISQTFSEFFSN